MSRIIGLTALVILLLTLPVLGQDSKINWQENLASALKKAAEEQKVILADFTGRKN